MTSLNFPTPVNVGQVFQTEDTTFVWNGALWVVLSPSSATFATKAEAEAGLRSDVFLSPARAKEAIAAQVPPPPTVDVGVAICRAWCRFDGVAMTLLGGFNVASVSRVSAGSFLVTFETPLPDANYIILANARGRTSDNNHPVLATGLSQSFPSTAAACRVLTGTTGGVNSTGFQENSSLVHASMWS